MELTENNLERVSEEIPKEHKPKVVANRRLIAAGSREQLHLQHRECFVAAPAGRPDHLETTARGPRPC